MVPLFKKGLISPIRGNPGVSRTEVVQMREDVSEPNSNSTRFYWQELIAEMREGSGGGFDEGNLSGEEIDPWKMMSPFIPG